MSNVYRSNKKSGGITPTGTKQITINAAGTTTHDVAAYANAEITTSGLVVPTGTKTITQNGTGIDVANYAAVDVNVSGGSLDETLLWENPNPSSSYGENTVTLNDSVQNYDYLRFEFTRGTTNPEIFSVIYTVDELDNTAQNQNGEKLSSPTIFIAGTGYYTRVLAKVSDTSIVFANGKKYTESGTTNSPTSLMPYKIFGLKLGGADMPELDFDNAITITTAGITTSTNGAVIGGLASSSAINVTADDEIIADIAGNTRQPVCVQFIPAGTVLKLSGASNSTLNFVPYKTNI